MIFIIIPAYNEEKNISLLVPKIHSVLGPINLEYKILVVNDGSNDGTYAQCVELSRKFPLEVLSHPVNMGVGQTFLTGLKAVASRANSDDIILLMEADSTNDPGCLQEMILRIKEGWDIVIASRYRKGGGYMNFPLRRKIFSLAANFLMGVFSPVEEVKDYTIFYWAYKAGLLEKAFDFWKDKFITYSGFEANEEVLLKLRRFNPRILEVPLVYDYGLKAGKSKMRLRKSFLELIHLIVQTYIGQRRYIVASYASCKFYSAFLWLHKM